MVPFCLADELGHCGAGPLRFVATSGGNQTLEVSGRVAGSAALVLSDWPDRTSHCCWAR